MGESLFKTLTSLKLSVNTHKTANKTLEMDWAKPCRF